MEKMRLTALMVRMEKMKVIGVIVETDMMVMAAQTVTMEQIVTIVRKSRDAIFPLHSRVKEWLSRATFRV